MARRQDPSEDAAVALAVRAAVGPDVVLRADANRMWSLSSALQFGREAADAGLQVTRRAASAFRLLCMDVEIF